MPIGRHDLCNEIVKTTYDRRTGAQKKFSRQYETITLNGVDLALNTDHRRRTVTFEASVPRVLRGTNEVPASAEEVLHFAESAYEAAARRVDWDCRWQDLEVQRVDLARGFSNVHDIDTVLVALSRLPQSRGRVRKIFNDPRSGGASTLTVEVPRRWRATAYDKPTEMLWAARRASDPRLADHLRGTALALRAEGHLRAEISIRRQALADRTPSTTIAAIATEGTMNHLAQHYFQFAGLDHPVGGTDHAKTAINAMTAHPQYRGVADRVIAMLVRDALGVPQTASKNCLSDYRRIAHNCGLSAGDFVAPDQPRVRLDWPSGSLAVEEDVA